MKKIASPTMAPIKTTPPTTPPAIAPTLGLDDLLTGPEVPVADPRAVEVKVPLADDSGWSDVKY
jgi:hypothetical protein